MQMISVTNGAFAYDEVRVQNNAPTVIYLHGAGGMRAAYSDDLMQPPNYHAIRLDLPHHGDSDTFDDDLRSHIEEYTEDTIHFMDALKLDKAIICGHSMSGGVALDAACRYPDRTLGSIMINSSAHMRVNDDVVGAMLNEVRRATDDVIDIILPDFLNIQVGDSEGQQGYSQFLRMNPRVAIRDFLACHRFDYREQLPSIETPLLVIAGEEDEVYPVEHNHFVADSAPNATMRVLRGIGHFALGESPSRVTNLISSWISDQRFAAN